MTKTERQICETFVTLMKEKNYSAIKVSELTRTAGISRSTFYTYFDSIEDVLQAVEEDFLSHLENEQNVPKCKDFSKVTSDFAYVRSHMDVFETLTGKHGDLCFRTEIGNRSKRIFYQLAQNHGTKLTAAQIEMLAEFNQSGKLQIFRWWSEHEDEVSVKEIVELLDRLESSVRSILTNK